MREIFERWYLQVVRGHPNNLTKDENGGYKYLVSMYLAWKAATLIEREACAKVCERHEQGQARHGEFALAEQSRQDACAIRERSN